MEAIVWDKTPPDLGTIDMRRTGPDALVIRLNGGSGLQMLLEPSRQSISIRSGRVILESGKDCGQHTTAEYEELLVFLSGEGVLELGDGRRLDVGEGVVAYIRPQTIHNVINTGQRPLSYIYCVVPAGR